MIMCTALIQMSQEMDMAHGYHITWAKYGAALETNEESTGQNDWISEGTLVKGRIRAGGDNIAGPYTLQ